MTKTLCVLLLLGVLLTDRVDAQSPLTGTAQTATAGQEQPAADPFGRGTPRGSVVGLVTAVEQGNLERAAEYLAAGLTPARRRELAEQLAVVLDRKALINPGQLSDRPEGNLDDGLNNQDRIGLIESPTGNVEVFVDRVQRGQGNAIWLFSSSVWEEVPRLYAEVQPPWIERYLPEALLTPRWLAVPLYRWIFLVLFVPALFGLAALSTRALTALLTHLSNRLSRVSRRVTPEHDLGKLAGAGALRLLVLAILTYVASFFGFSLATRYFWNRVSATLMVVALCWLALRLLDFVAELSLKRLERVHRSADTALVRLINRLSKAAMVIVAGLVLLYLADVDLTAALTGLGVGGLAIGFGAQKTIENLFGGIMVISDKPVNVGDVCRAGEFFGTVEDIGIRSTRIRTLDRTVVSVPNGQLAVMSLENFALRDRIRFHHTVGLRRQTTADQLRDVLGQIRRLFESDPRVESTSARTRFIRISAFSLELELFAYILERDQAAFLAVQEELLLGVMDILEKSGTSLALPLNPTPSAKDPALT